jgi:L-amino acid N-acyltransferase YncA
LDDKVNEVSLYCIKKYQTKTLVNSKLYDSIIAFDRLNMRAILEEVHVEFDETMRKANFNNNDIIYIASNNEKKIIGYLEYGRHKNNPENIYIPSIQIEKEFRRGKLIWDLLYNARIDLLEEDFNKISCNVHKSNKEAINIYRKLGFKIEEIPGNEVLLRVYSGKEILINPIFEWLGNRKSKTQ